MDKLEAILDKADGVRGFLGNILVPSVFTGYYLLLIQNVNASTAVFQTYLFVAHYFLLTANKLNSVFLLVIEISCTLTTHVYASNNFLVYLFISMMLSILKIEFRILNVHHIGILAHKCKILLLLKYIFAAPEYIMTLYWIGKVMDKYTSFYKRKSYHDIILFALVCGILQYLAVSMDALEDSTIHIILPGIFLVSWLICKPDYYLFAISLRHQEDMHDVAEMSRIPRFENQRTSQPITSHFICYNC